MTPAPYTEDVLVQQTTADYLEHQLGWESIYAYNTEDFGPTSLLGRTSDREVVLTRHLHAALRSLNPGLPDAAYDDAVQQITATAASQTLVVANRKQYDLLRDSVPVTFHNDKGERVRQRLKVFDFETPENNHFLCARVVGARRPLPPASRHRGLCQRPAPAVHRVQEHPPQPQGRFRSKLFGALVFLGCQSVLRYST